MKKIFAFALAAAAVLSCSKTETTFNQSEEIAFMPVSRIESRAAVQGTNYTASQNFYVFANTVESTSHKYFENVQFIPETVTEGSTTSNVTTTVNGATLQVFKGADTQYWPNVTPLKFAGVTASGNVNDGTAPEMAADFTTMTVEGYVQTSPTTANANNDLMYFFADNNGAGYAKGSGIVSPVMAHACSWITINVVAESALTSYWDDLQITNVSLLGLYESGDATFTASGASWDIDSYEPTNKVDVLTVAKELSTTSDEFADVENNTIVIPQTPVTLSVTYSYTTPAGITDFTETKEIELSDYTDTENWNAGVHYTYNLTVTAEEIKIAPTSTTWGDPVTTPIPTPQQ